MPRLVMPSVGEGVTEGTVTRWLKREGEAVGRDEPVVEVETDKALVEIPCPCDGTLARILVPQGTAVPVGTLLAELGAAGAPPADGQGRCSPAVRGLAAAHGVDLALLRGTGSGGRVTRSDVLRHLEGAPPGAARLSRDAELRPHTPTRRTVAARLLEAHRTIPVAWLAVEADVTGLVALRARLRDAFEQGEGARLTYLPFFVGAVAVALAEHAELNATFSDEGLTVHRRLDLGIAMATDWGLVVPVIRDAGEKTLRELARELAQLGARARQRKLGLEELRDATFTIDNTGAFGSILSQPIVPPGQVAIVTTEVIRRELRPTADGGFAPRSLMNLCLSFDHRALDGAEPGRFLQAVRARLEAYRGDQQVC